MGVLISKVQSYMIVMGMRRSFNFIWETEWQLHVAFFLLLIWLWIWYCVFCAFCSLLIHSDVYIPWINIPSVERNDISSMLNHRVSNLSWNHHQLIKSSKTMDCINLKGPSRRNELKLSTWRNHKENSSYMRLSVLLQHSNHTYLESWWSWKRS